MTQFTASSEVHIAGKRGRADVLDFEADVLALRLLVGAGMESKQVDLYCETEMGRLQGRVDFGSGGAVCGR